MPAPQSTADTRPRCYICGVAPVLATLDQCKDCSEILVAATKAIARARQDGVPIYGPSSWRQANMAHRLDHAATHIYQYKRGDRDEDHLAHAICDLVFVYATRD